MNLRRILSFVVALTLSVAGVLVPVTARAADTTVSGTVTLPGGEPASEGGWVWPYTYVGDHWEQFGDPVDTDGSGSWALTLPAGTYRFEAGAPYYWSVYYPDATTVEDATSVVVGDTAVTGIDMEVRDAGIPFGGISGRVVSEGSPLEGAVVHIYDSEGYELPGFIPISRPDGTFFTFRDPGAYKVRVTKDGYIPVWVGGVDEATATEFDVVERQTTKIGDVSLTAGVLPDGSAAGRVVDGNGEAVADAWVFSCVAGTGDCVNTMTGASGEYSYAALPTGSYEVTVFPPADSPLRPGNGEFQILGGEVTTVPDIVLAAPEPLPGNTTLTHVAVTDNGEPVVFWLADLTLTTHACQGAQVYYAMSLGSRILHEGDMAEGPAGTYSATIPKAYPDHGAAHIDIKVTCPGGTQDDRGFDIYIDPSGTVVNQYGVPLAAATVTLSRSDAEGGPYAVVADGDSIMSPGNRRNPDVTSSFGEFGWDVIPGWYKVTASAARCDSGSTDQLPVPPPQLDLEIVLSCQDAPAPSSPPKITGDAKANSTLEVQAGTWPSGIGVTDYQWRRDGHDLAGAKSQTYTVTAADAGKDLAVRLTLKRPGYAEFTFVTEAVQVADVPTSTQPPATQTPTTQTPATGRTKQGVAGKVAKKVAVGKPVKLPRRSTAGQRLAWKTLTKKTCKVKKKKASARGLKPGVCKIRAKAPGSATLLPLRKAYRLKVVRAKKH
ncbi:MAG: hypothetical protein R2720_09940 [Candidatus Nanopelagicales bacterium]